MDMMIIPLIARILIGIYFIFFGVWNSAHWQPTLVALQQKKLPLAPILLALAIAWQIIAGLFILCNLFLPWAAFSLIFFTLIATFIIHPFWRFKGDKKTLNFIIFITNTTVTIAALLLLTIKTFII